MEALNLFENLSSCLHTNKSAATSLNKGLSSLGSSMGTVGIRAGAAVNKIIPFEKTGRSVTSVISQAAKAADDFNKKMNDLSLGCVRSEKRIGDLKNQSLNFVSETRAASFADIMAPFAKAGRIASIISPAIKTADDFNKKINNLSLVSGISSKDLEVLRNQSLSLASETGAAALEIAAAQKIMASEGIKTRDILTSMPDFATLAAASGSDLASAVSAGTAALSSFKSQALGSAEISDILASASNNTGVSMKYMETVIGNAGKAAVKAGADFSLVTAVTSKLSKANLSAQESSASVNSMFKSLITPSASAAEALGKLGITTENLDFTQVMTKLESGLKGMASVDRSKYLEQIFGQDAVKGVNAVLDEGIGKILAYSDTLGKSTGTAAETAKIKMNNLGASLKKLSASLNTLKIIFGSVFVPVLKFAADAANKVAKAFIFLAGTKAGKTIIEIAGIVLGCILVFFSLQGAIAAATAAASILGSVIMSVTAPVWIVIGAVTVLYLAWKNNFCGMKDYITKLWNKVSLVFRGIAAVFKSLTNGVGTIEGELAKDIKANGLLGVVTTVAKVIYRIKEYYRGLWEGLSAGFSKMGDILKPVFESVAGAVKPLFQIISYLGKVLFGAAASTDSSTWHSFGKIVGTVVGGAFQVLAWCIRIALTPFKWMMDIIGFLLGGIVKLGQAAGSFSTSVLSKFSIIPDFFRKIGNAVLSGFKFIWKGVKFIFMNFTPLGWIIKGFGSLLGFISGFSLSGAAKKLWDSFTGVFKAVPAFFSGLWNKIASKIQKGIEKVKGFFSLLNPMNLIRKAFKGKDKSSDFSFGGMFKGLLANIPNPFSGLYKKFKSGISGSFSKIKGLIAALNPFKLLKKAFTGITNIFPELNFGEIAEKILGKITGVFTALPRALAGVFKDAKAAIAAKLQKLGAFISKLNPFNYIKKAFGGFDKDGKKGFFSKAFSLTGKAAGVLGSGIKGVAGAGASIFKNNKTEKIRELIKDPEFMKKNIKLLNKFSPFKALKLPFKKIGEIFSGKNIKGLITKITPEYLKLMNTMIPKFKTIPFKMIKTAAGISLVTGLTIHQPGLVKEKAGIFEKKQKNFTQKESGEKIIIQNLVVSLPDVSDSRSFLNELETLVTNYERGEI